MDASELPHLPETCTGPLGPVYVSNRYGSWLASRKSLPGQRGGEQVACPIDCDMQLVWTPIWAIDDIGSAKAYMPSLPDPRARVWWDQFNVLSDGLSPFFNGVKPVWDVYLIYEAGKTWGVEGTNTPGQPDYYQHQLGASLPPALKLNKAVFIDEIMLRLPACDVVSAL